MSAPTGQAVPLQDPARHDVPAGGRTRQPDRWLGRGLWLLAGGLTLNTALGPLLTGWVSYSFSESLRNQTLGLEAVSLLLVAPLCGAAAVLVRRGRPAGAVLALGPAGYTAYMAAQYVVAPGYTTHPRVLVLHLGLFVTAGLVAVRAWRSVRPDELPALSPRSTRRWAWTASGLAAFVASRYLPALMTGADATGLAPEFDGAPAMYWTIFLLDLGVVVPVTVSCAVALRRRGPSAVLLLHAVVGWFALVPPSVAAMAVVMLARHDPAASWGDTVLLVLATVVFAGCAVRLYAPLLRARPVCGDQPLVCS